MVTGDAATCRRVDRNGGWLLQDEVLHADLGNVWFRYQQQLHAADEMLAQKRVSQLYVRSPNINCTKRHAHTKKDESVLFDSSYGKM